jgi:hypothetical protein
MQEPIALLYVTIMALARLSLCVFISVKHGKNGTSFIIFLCTYELLLIFAGFLIISKSSLYTSSG